MAPRKRSRALDDVDGDVEVESASSSFRSSFPKRPRPAHARDNGGSVISDDEDAVDDNQGDMDDAIPLPGSSDDEQEGDEFDELRATQIIQKQMGKHKENIASESGIIEEVYCRNFMCHSKLRIRLGPLINFIIGHNGSGKSAVLTALTMCLGGKATTSNRGANLKSLIKTGQDNASLAVKIKNRGEGAFKPELYGQSITVERHFSRNGTSGFKIRNENDKVISTRRSPDLDDILDYFAFQLDNPINVLSQDLARQFLSNSTPTDKYKFFIRGTQLESLDNDYKILEENVDSVEETLRVREDDLEILKTKAQEAEEKKRQIESVAKLQSNMTRLQHQHAWAQVGEQEEALRGCNNDVANAEADVREQEGAAEPLIGSYDGQDQAFEAAKQFVITQEAALEPAQQHYDTEKEKWDAHYQEATDLKAEQRNIKDSIKNATKEIARLGNDVAQEQERLAGVHGTAHQDRMAKLKELKDKAGEAERAHKEHDSGFDELKRARDAAVKEHEQARPAQTDAAEAVRQAQSTLSQLQGNANNQFAGYHESVARAVKEINRETRWRSKPVGPMGMHVHVLKPEWSSQLERTFGGVLDSFGVTSKEDQIILRQILQRCNCRSQIYMGRPEALDTTGKEPQEDVDTMLRVLRIDDDLVRNTFIINTAIEQTVLIKDQQEAYRFMYENGGRPKNVRAVIAQAAQRGAGMRNEYTRNGAQKISPVQAWAGQPRLRADRKEQLRQQQQRVEQAKQDEEEVAQRIRGLQQEQKRAEQAIFKFKRDQKDLHLKRQQADDAVDAMQTEIDSNRPQDGRLQELEKQLQEARDEKRNAENSYQDSVVQHDQLGRVGRDIKAGLDQADADLAQAKTNVEKAKKRVDRVESERMDALYKKNEAINAIDNAKKQLTRLEGLRDQQQNVVDEYLVAAGTVCARVRVDEGMTPDKLDRQIDVLEKQYKRIEQSVGGTREELFTAWKQAEDDLRNARKQTAEMTRVVNTIKAALTERHRRWGLFRKYISARARISFGYLLSERSFRGRVILDHDGKKLDIHVEPDLTKVSDAGRQTKTLSGGEKSFSTICLLLSIWEAMGSPIRCLDEFDVFMDSVNRATSMTMMIQAARRSVGRQFILITPQSMNNAELGDDVKIHRMSDPERGQTTLPFGE